MSSVHFYRRYAADGRCKVICMHCFQTLGTAWDRHSIEEMEAGHECEFRSTAVPAAASRVLAKRMPSITPLLQRLLQIPTGVLAVLTMLMIYGLPTALELAARHELNAWLAVIVPGDLVGCAVLAGLLRKPRAGALLYLVLTMIEGLSYASGAARGRELLWFADLVPMLVVLTLVLRMKLRSRELAIP